MFPSLLSKADNKVAENGKFQAVVCVLVTILKRKKEKVVPKHRAIYGIKTYIFLLMQNRHDATKQRAVPVTWMGYGSGNPFRNKQPAIRHFVCVF